MSSTPNKPIQEPIAVNPDPDNIPKEVTTPKPIKEVLLFRPPLRRLVAKL